MKVSRLIDRALGHRIYTWIQTAGPVQDKRSRKLNKGYMIQDTDTGYRCMIQMQDTDSVNSCRIQIQDRNEDTGDRG